MRLPFLSIYHRHEAVTHVAAQQLQALTASRQNGIDNAGTISRAFKMAEEFIAEVERRAPTAPEL